MFCCHGRLVCKKNARDRRPLPNQRARAACVWLGGRLRENEAGELARQNPRPPRSTALHSKASTTSPSSTLALRQHPPTFDSAVDPALLVQRLCPAPLCCRPALFKVRHSIRGALNPYILPPPAPDTMPRCTASSPHAPTAWLPQDSCIRLPDLNSHNPVQSPALASVLAYGVLLSETQYRQWRLILAASRTSGGSYTTLRYTLP